MILFPSCKINLGLNVLSRRSDGYHDIESVMYPVRGLYDTVEIVCNGENGLRFSSSGAELDCGEGDNICVRAFELMHRRYGISGVDMHLHKTIPFGAGLGGGSADGVAVLKILNEMFGVGLDTAGLEALAGELGSDTVFFVRDLPALAQGRGERLSPVDVNLSGYYITIVKPDLFVSTGEAYKGVVPAGTVGTVAETVSGDIGTWKDNLVNDFEPSVFKRYPQIAAVKEQLYAMGAVYASMSGSGSAVYGIFEEEPRQSGNFQGMFVYVGRL